MSEYRFDTLAVHAGQVPDPTTGALAMPLYQTSSYQFESVQHAADLFALRATGNIYSRIMNPTNDVFEQRMAALEGGIGAVSTSSGHAALVMILLNLCRAGDNIVSSSALYGGTYNLLTNTMPTYGIQTHMANPDVLESFEKRIDDHTRAVLVESIGNPGINLVDIRALADIAHRHGLPLIVDNTFATPYLFRPIEHGADIVFHSATKYICGQGTTLGGVVIDAGKFDWASGRFAQFTTPDPGYHDAVYTEMFGAAAFIAKARVHILRDFGMCQSPFDNWLLVQGLSTLSLRMERHVSNAEALTTHLKNHPRVSWVNYPGLAGDRYEELCKRDFPKGAGGIFAFGIRGGREAGAKFIDALKLCAHVANVADVKSMVIHPASTTHSQLSEQAQLAAGVKPDMVRMSVGIEDIADIIDDIDQALEASAK